MTTSTLPPGGPPAGKAPASKEEQPVVEYGKNRHTGFKMLAILVVWGVLYAVLKGTDDPSARLF